MKFLPYLNPANWLRRPPTDPLAPGVSLGESPAFAHTVSVDRIHGALREAEAGSTLALFDLYREIRLGHSHTQTLFNQRKLAVLTRALTIAPEDDANPADVLAAEAAQAITKTPGWLTTACNHLLNGHLYPVSVLAQSFAPAPAGSGLRYLIRGWQPVPYRLLDWSDGRLMILDADPATGHRLITKREPQPLSHIIHRGHLLTDIPDHWGGPMRAALFWWLFASQDRDWWVRFLDRFGAPFLVGKYDPSDSKTKSVLTRAFSQATRLFGLVVSRETDVEVNAVASNSHGEAFQAFQEFANGELSKLILGQTMTVSAQAGGLGGAQAEVQEGVKDDIRAFDLTILAETVNAQIIAPFLAINGIPGRAVLQVAADSSRDLDGRTKFLQAATLAGLEPTDAGLDILSDASGIPLQRRSSSVPSFGVSPFSAAPPAFDPAAARRRIIAAGHPTDEQLDSIADKAAPDLAAAFRGRYAPVADVIAASTSADDLEHRLHIFFSDLPPGRLRPLIEDALTAYAATGAATARRG